MTDFFERIMVLYYSTVFCTAHEIKTVRQCTEVQEFSSDFEGTQSRRAIVSDTIIPSQTLAANGDPPRTNTCRECTNSRSQSFLNRQHPLQEQGRLRAGYETPTEAYEVLLYCLIHYGSTRATLLNQHIRL